MYKKPSKQQLLLRRIAMSVVASLLVVITVTITVLFMLGYRFDSGSIEQGALLQFDSSPNGADVWVDDKLVNGRTATKQTVLSGQHTVTMAKNGYEEWTRTLNLAAGTLTWLDYIRFIPVDRPAEEVLTYENLVSATFSPENRWVLAQETADQPVFQLIDLRSETVTASALTISQDLITDATTEGVAHTYAVKSWNSGGRYVLIKHSYGDKTEWLTLDTQDRANDRNITRSLSIDLQDVAFMGTNGTTFYGLAIDGTLRKLDVNASTISGALISQVQSFTLFDSSIIQYIGVDTATNTKLVGVYRDGDSAPHVLRSGAAMDTPLAIAATRYYSKDYVAIAEGAAVTILRGSYPGSSDQDASSLQELSVLPLQGAVTSLSFSPEGDFMLVQSGAEYFSYELEHLRAATGTVSADVNGTIESLRWLDEAHLWSGIGEGLVMRDFNGINAHQIMNVTPGFGASLSQNGRFFYGIHRTDAGFVLQRVTMVL